MFLRFCVIALLLAVAGSGGFAVKVMLLSKRGRATENRERAKKLHLTRGSELVTMFEMNEFSPSPANLLEVDPGTLMRIQGRVVGISEQQLLAPFTKRPAVMYSASVANQRLDDVHQPPVAFHSTSLDFVVEIADMPELKVTIHDSDVVLFDMVDGAFSKEMDFAEAPDAWRSFALAHCRAGAAGSYMGSTAGELEFRECALTVGTMVTCIGEVTKDWSGALGLHPWRPPQDIAETLGKSKGDSYRDSWLSNNKKSLDVEGFIGRVMISDDPEIQQWM